MVKGRDPDVGGWLQQGLFPCPYNLLSFAHILYPISGVWVTGNQF